MNWVPEYSTSVKFSPAARTTARFTHKVRLVEVSTCPPSPTAKVTPPLTKAAPRSSLTDPTGKVAFVQVVPSYKYIMLATSPVDVSAPTAIALPASRGITRFKRPVNVVLLGVHAAPSVEVQIPVPVARKPAPPMPITLVGLMVVALRLQVTLSVDTNETLLPRATSAEPLTPMAERLSVGPAEYTLVHAEEA